MAEHAVLRLPRGSSSTPVSLCLMAMTPPDQATPTHLPLGATPPDDPVNNPCGQPGLCTNDGTERDAGGLRRPGEGRGVGQPSTDVAARMTTTSPWVP